MTEAERHCQEVVRAADRDRFLAALFAPAELRSHLLALYAFDLELRRVTDVVREPMAGEIRLQWWREVVGGERRDEALAHPVAASLLHAVEACDLPRDQLATVIDTHRLDLYEDSFPDSIALEKYARESDGTMLALATRLMGAPQSPPAWTGDAAHALVVARVLRDLPKRVSQRQTFLPRDILDLDGASELRDGRAGQEIRAALVGMARAGTVALRRAASELGSGAPAMSAAWLPLAPARIWLLRIGATGDPFSTRYPSQLRGQWEIWRAERNAAVLLR